MDLVIFKVVFKAFEQYESKNLTLSFKNIILDKPILVSSESIHNLEILSETNQNIIFFRNIEEVITIGDLDSNYVFNYYLVILYTIKSNGKKVGYLIGNIKQLGDIVIGVWPFTTKGNNLSRDSILGSLEEIIKNISNYSKVCIVSQ
jgi:hypothetical protein